jgi:sigma-54 dependent transcriptional regulator, acetoin dehydrogenase operon transcriptional activator AcoR
MSLKTETLDIGGEPSAAPGGPGLVTLYAPDPKVVPAAVVLPEHALVLGREPPPGGLALPFASVSRVHARVAHQRGAITVEDLESRNGSFVNGTKVERATLEHGDELRIGELVFKVVATGAERFVDSPLEGRTLDPPLQALRGGSSMDRVRSEIVRIARADLSVLVLGETGSGKELVARALHDASGRSGRLSTVNCAAIPANLLESELFGYKRGAFTGADRDRMGIVKSADGGTLFLDEIGEMPLEAQAKVLRIIETRQVTPLGSHVGEPVDLRIVCATHRPLPRLVQEERFRGDLFARINAHTIELPPLRDRKEDIFQLVHFFLERAGAARLRVTAAFMIGLVGYDWPFNVRELEAAIKRAIALADDTLDERHLPTGAAAALKELRKANEAAPDGALANARTGETPTATELRALLKRHAGNVAAVGRELGKDRVQVRRWLKRYGISPAEFRSG